MNLPFDDRFLSFGLLLVFLGKLGYLLSDRAQSLVGEVKEVEKWLLGGLIIAVAAVLVLRALSKRTR